MDRRSRSGDSASALWCRPACCRGDVADSEPASDRFDIAGYGQEIKDARGSDCPGGPRSDRKLCAAMPISPPGRSAVVPRREGRAAQSRPRKARCGGGSAAARSTRYAYAARTQAQLRDALACSRCGSESASGIAWAREPFLDADLYGGGRSTPSRRLSPRPPPRLGAARCGRRGPPDRGVSRRAATLRELNGNGKAKAK